MSNKHLAEIYTDKGRFVAYVRNYNTLTYEITGITIIEEEAASLTKKQAENIRKKIDQTGNRRITIVLKK